MKTLAMIMVLAPGLAMAEDWRAMTGAEIAAALTDRGLVYADATQHFFASGRTRYDAGQESWGYWAVREDRYCSQWPPSDTWACYEIARNGELLRFVAEDGSATDGTLTE